MGSFGAVKTVLETIQSGTPWLERAGVENARLNMEHLLAHVLGCRRLDLYLQFDRPLSEAELAPLRELVKRRGKREPLQHLLGSVEFCGRDFRCDARALIPRPETEELTERLIRLWGEAGRESPPRILDMGTGSGVIGLSLLHAIPGSTAVLADVSPEALELAKENAERTGMDLARCTFVESDLFSALGGERFDLVAANLPYIAADEIGTLSPEVQRDPRLALEGGAAGTEVIERFLRDLPDHGRAGGIAGLETGSGQTVRLAEVMRNFGLREVRALNDYSGHDRFLVGRFP